VRAAVVVLALIVASPAAAQPVRPQAARPKIVVAPLATLGAESSAADVRAAQNLVTRAITELGSVDLVSQPVLLQAIRRARRPELRACDGDATCLADLGQLVGAGYAVYGEVGGLGSAHVVYLKLVDVRERREVRSEVLEMGRSRPAAAEARAAATRLLAPSRYVGHLVLDTSVRGASIFVDGERVSRSPSATLTLAVGSHALRVTHPEYRDFVRFVEIEFGATSRVAVPLQPYRAIAGDIRRQSVSRPAPVVDETPWYARWYTIAGAGALLLVTSAVAVGLATGGLDFDLEKDL
jgi:PEGA domain